ncbi:MAG TPA: adenylate kinase [Prolixibacteraceae bacterium]|jgi:adenylate kinase|nr:adenylate kinase [Prolixibacteraceae bacterium]
MLNLVLFGPPGAGKGTQADFLIEKFKLIHLSTGDLLRSQIAAKTEMGIEAKSYMDRGFLAPDWIVISMIKSILQENVNANGYIFDGFPRTVEQAWALDVLLEEMGTPVSGMLCLIVDKDELIKRILLRGITSGRPDDQDVSIIENRIHIYNEKTLPLTNYYSAQNKYFKIDGMGSVEEIAHRLIDTVSKL